VIFRRRIQCVFLLMSCLLPLAVLHAAPQPWEFADKEEARAVQVRRGRRVYRNYTRAREAVISGPGSQVESIERLMLAIGREPRSSAKKFFLNAVKTDDYFPYYYLGWAFERQGDYESARLCLDEAARQGAVVAADEGDRFRALRASVRNRLSPPQPVPEPTPPEPASVASASTVDLAARVDQVDRWSTGQVAGVQLGARSRRKLDELHRVADQWKTARDGGESVRAKAAADKIVNEIYALTEVELENVKARLARYSKPPWKAAFQGNPREVSTRPCRLVPAYKTPELIESAQKTLEECSYRLLQAMRKAGPWACKELERRAAELSAAGQSSDLPPLPQACEGSWAVSRRELEGRSIDLPAAIAALDVAAAPPGGSSAGHSPEPTPEGRQVQLQLPPIPADCAATLQIEASAGRLEELRRRGAADEIAVEDTVNELLVEALEGVTQLLGYRAGCASASERAGIELELQFEIWERSGASEDPARLCAAAATATRELDDCWSADPDRVVAQLRDSGELLLSARQEWNQAGGWGFTPQRFDCMARNPMRAALPGGDPADWVATARSDLGRTGKCLKRYREAWQRGVDGIGERVVAAADEIVPAGRGMDGNRTELAAHVREAAQEVGRLTTQFAALTELRGLSRLEPEEVRIQFDALSLTQVGEAAWGRLGRTAAEDPLRSPALQSVRARAAADALTLAVARIESWERLAQGLRPFVLLHSAFAGLTNEGLDEAIRRLRAGNPGAGEGRAAQADALVHTALAYFLYLKSLSYPNQGPESVFVLLQRQATDSIARVLGVAPSFRPPEALFAHQGFRQFFENARAAGAGGG